MGRSNCWTHYHYADPIESSKDQEWEPILASRTNLPLFIPYIILHMSRVARTGLPLLLVPSLTPQLPLVIHHGLTLLSFLWHGNSSLGHLLLLEHVALREWVAGTESARVGLMGSMSSLGGSGLDRPVE